MNNYKLIDGTFSANDATKILLEIINNKINYHHLHVFSVKERFNGDVSHSEKRIKELTKIGKSIRKTLDTAEKKGLRVEIHCPIEIKVIK
jgi:hypothetical protein